MKIAVIGAGSWGTAVANLLAKKDYSVYLWAREQQLADYINQNHKNKYYLTDINLSNNLVSSSDFSVVLSDVSAIVLVVPSQHMRQVVRKMKPYLSNSVPVVSLSKGIEIGTNDRMSQVLAKELPNSFKDKIAILSGPNHAEEVSKEIPSATVISSTDKEVAYELQKIFMTPYFRVYTNNDLTGVEFGAAVKNVIAIAAGVSDGLGFGDNTKASLMTRGLAEMTRLGVYFGAKPITFSGLSGVGDLIATATSRHSRNRYYGEQFAKGKSLDEIAVETKMVAEGVKTCLALRQISQECQIELPINEAVVQVLHEGKPPLQAVKDLMSRGAREEAY